MKQCSWCGKEFTPYHKKHQIYCTPVCMNKARNNTDAQYGSINGNWDRYLVRLTTNRGKISKDALLKLIEKQDYKCALSGVPLTCQVEKGKRCLTNASLDRIIPGGEYEIGNVRLVCYIVNFMRYTNSDEDFINWCRTVVKYNDEKEAIQ